MKQPISTPSMHWQICIVIPIAVLVIGCMQDPNMARVCSESAATYEVSAWIDENGNGQWDAAESPLPDVQIELRQAFCGGDPFFQAMPGSKFSLGQDGKESVSVLYACCGVDAIAATPPAGYRATTPQVQRVAATDGLQATVSFGFKRE